MRRVSCVILESLGSVLDDLWTVECRRHTTSASGGYDETQIDTTYDMVEW